MGKIKRPETPHRVTELRLGRTYVREGDLVRITPPEGSPKGTHGMLGRFVYADVDKGGLFVCVQYQERNDKGIYLGCGYRFVKPERIQRKAITHDPLKRAANKKEALKCAGSS